MQSTLDRHVLDPRHFYGFQHRQLVATAADLRAGMRDVNWQLRYVELDNRALADSELPVRVGRFKRIHTRAKHRVPNRHWMELMEFPRISSGLRDLLRLEEGQKADVMVCVRGSPQVRVEWFKDWLPMTETETVFIRHYRPDEYVLTIRDVQLADAGFYSCRVSNMCGTVRTWGQITVGPRSAERIAADKAKAEAEAKAKEEAEAAAAAKAAQK